MAQLIHLGSSAGVSERPRPASPEARRRGLLTGVLVALIVLALGSIGSATWLQLPSNPVARPATPDASGDSAVFDPHATPEQQRTRQAEQEEDGAVFGQAPSAAAYGTSGR